MQFEQILNPTHRVAIAYQHGSVGYGADAIRRHPTSETYDVNFLHRLNRLAEGALPSRTDVSQVRQCLITILKSEIGGTE